MHQRRIISAFSVALMLAFAASPSINAQNTVPDLHLPKKLGTITTEIGDAGFEYIVVAPLYNPADATGDYGAWEEIEMLTQHPKPGTKLTAGEHMHLFIEDLGEGIIPKVLHIPVLVALVAAIGFAFFFWSKSNKKKDD